MKIPHESPTWLVEECIPQISDDLRERVEIACKRGFTGDLMREVDEVILQATIAISKHYGRDLPNGKRPDRFYQDSGRTEGDD
jgi:hypothetical protein